jgi:G3E family GTPase
VRLNLLFGFLGSGKTTLARRILERRPKGRKIAVIVNEFGDVGIDGAILEGNSIDIIELTSGCLCCTLKGPLLNAIEELGDRVKPDQIVIEATGIAEPEEMIETFTDPKLRGRFDVGPLVTVVDAANFAKLREILGDFYAAQISHSDLIVLNKIDISSAEKLQVVQQEVEQLNPDATVYFAERCDIEVDEVLDGTSSRVIADRAVLSAARAGRRETEHPHHGPHHAPAQSFVLDATGGADRAGIEKLFASLPDNVWRAKGFMTIDNEPVLLQYSASGLDLSPAPRRSNEYLVFIGPNLDREAIGDRLSAVLAGKTRL